MAMDVVHVVQKGRHTLTAMTVKFEGERAAGPAEAVRVDGARTFDITGDVQDKVVARAIELSRDEVLLGLEHDPARRGVEDDFHEFNAESGTGQ